MNGGYKQFATDWSKGGVHLLLNHTFVDVADLPPGFISPRSTRIWLNVSDTAVPLKGRHVNDQAQYTEQQWFNVRQRGAARACRFADARLACVADRGRCLSGPSGTGTAT